MQMTFEEMLKAVNGEVIVQGTENTFNNLCIDTRKIAKNNVFLAIKGENFNGNDFVLKALELGASIIIVDEVKFDANEVKESGTYTVTVTGEKAKGSVKITVGE